MNFNPQCRTTIGTVVFILCLATTVALAQTRSGSFNVVCLADPTATDVTKGRACLKEAPRLTFRDHVTLAVEHAPNTSFDDADEPDPAQLVLFIDGKALPGAHPAVGTSQTDADDVTTTLLTYHLVRDLNTDEARKNWRDVLAAANSGRNLTVSTGMEKGPAAQSRALPVQFVTIRPGRLVIWGLAAVAGLIVFFVIAARTAALRDKEPADASLDPKKRAYSLSRVQIALWTMLVIYAFLFIWFLTGEYNATIPASAVALMGISLATFGSAAAVDAAKVQDKKEKLKKIDADLAAKPADEKAKLQAEKDAIKPQTVVCQSEGFFRDITTSAGGASLHRLQFIVWTLALAVIFVLTVWRTIAMPDFDSTLLALMGITSGAYVGLKVPESKC